MRRFVAVIVVGAACLMVMGAPAFAREGSPAAAEPVQEREGCKFGRWPADVNGKPAGLRPGGATGLYVWHTDEGWNLAVTHDSHEKYVFSGQIVSSTPIYAVERRTERADNVQWNRRGNVVNFRFTNYGGIDGIFFRMRCGPGFGVGAKLNGRMLSPEQVFVGADGHHPRTVPFRIQRVK